MAENNIHCVVNGCKHDRKEAGDMIRCVLCAIWFHHSCVELDASMPDGVWSCPSCRTIRRDVSSIKQTLEEVMGLLTTQTDITKRLTESLKNKTAECESLRQENVKLREKTDELTKLIDEGSTHMRSILLGSSIIREVDQEKLVNTGVICKRGGLIGDIQEEVFKLPDNSYSHIALVIGGNDCDKKPQKPAKDIVDVYGKLISVAKDKARHVTVSSICPRIRSNEIQQCIDAVNAGLVETCSEMGVTYADSTPCFKLGDGSISDGYLTRDGVHITQTATNKLAKVMKLKIKNISQGVCTENWTEQNKDRSNGWQRPDRSREWQRPDRSREWQRPDKSGVWQRPDKSDVWQRPDKSSEWTVVTKNQQYRRRPYLNSQSTDRSTCHFCGESGHVKHNCRHGQQIQCHSCLEYGHKSKHCGTRK